jgi:hypothetical protein
LIPAAAGRDNRKFLRPFFRCLFTKGSEGAIKCVAGAGVAVVESKRAGGARIREAQAESLRGICDLRHGRFKEPNALRINPRRRLLDRSSPKLSRRTQSRPGSDLGCHHLHHQVVDLSEGHLTIIVLRPDRLRSSFRPSGVIRTYSQGELPFFLYFCVVSDGE